MTKTFTQADLIRYLYHETTENEDQEINKALLCDNKLRALYSNLCTAKKQLDAAQLEPSAKTVNNILEYSRTSVPQKH